jgi:hypothetical protein
MSLLSNLCLITRNRDWLCWMQYDVLNSSPYCGLNDHPSQQEIPSGIGVLWHTFWRLHRAAHTQQCLNFQLLDGIFLNTSSITTIYLYAEDLSVRSIGSEVFRFVVVISSDSFEMVISRQNLALRTTCPYSH